MVRAADSNERMRNLGSEALAETLDGVAAGSAVQPPVVQTFSAPRQVGRFVLLRHIGSGGMGAVYAAYDERLDRRVAIKLLQHAETADDVQKQRVLREAQAMARVSDPNVVSVFEVGEVHSQVFIAMEFVEGVTLAEWQRQRPRKWQDLLLMYLEAGQGLRAAHAVGLTHRDFKPDNVLVGKEGRPRVADFGLARLGAGTPAATPGAPEGISGEKLAAPLTLADAVAGTPGYMSPEQYSGGEVDARSDQFSFCAALYEALYRQLPFAGDELAALAANTVAGKVQPRPDRSEVPIEVHQALMRGLAVDPGKRYRSMDDLLSALRLEHGHSAGGASASRRQFVTMFIIGVVAIQVLMQSRLDNRSLSLWDTLAADGAAFAIMCGFGIIWRRALLRNVFHRRVWLAFMITTLPRPFVALVAIHYKIALLPFLVMDVMGMVGSTGFIAALFFPSLWWLPVFQFGVACATAFYGAPVLWINVASHAVSGGACAVAWNQAAGRVQREMLAPAATR